MIWVNFKIYKQTFGSGALGLAKICRQVSEKTKVKIIPVVSALDLRLVKQEVGGPVWIQNLDLHVEGKHTGFISPLAAITAGADGALLNHSEHELPPGKINQIVSLLKKDKWLKKWQKDFNDIDNLVEKIKQFEVMVCFKTKGQISWLKRIKPAADLVAYEPPELIGTKTSVSQAQPETVARVKKLLPDHRLVVGAGINSKQDVLKSLQLGASGVLVSSAIVCADDPQKELTDLASGF